VQRWADLADAGTFAVSSDRSKAERFVTLFVLPLKAGAVGAGALG